jgi:hypothetical protein
VIPQVNAILTKVSRQGSTDEWRDTEAVIDTTLWEGAAPAYYQERRERTSSGQSEALLVRRSLIVDIERPLLDWESELAVEFNVAGAARTGIVQNVERRMLPTATLQTCRLTLEVE